jgi:surface antigen
MPGLFARRRGAVIAVRCVTLALAAFVALPVAASHAGTDDYPSVWRNAPQDSTFDTWHEDNRECTSFVAWRLHSRNGFEMPFNDNASGWGPDARARGFAVNSTPAIGSVAWTSANHVAWVEAVSGATVTVEDYNSDFTGHYGEHTVAASSYQYIHFKDLPSGGGTTGGGDRTQPDLASNGGFENGWGPWSAYPGTSTNWVDYQSGQVSGESARSGLHYGATNTSSGGGGIYEDVAVSTSPGQVVCASAWVRNQYPSSGGSGQFVVWLLGGSYNENGVASFSGLGNGSNWRQLQTCVSASTPHSVLRIQLYPQVGGPTVDIDDVDVH